MTSIAGDRGKGKGYSVAIGLRTGSVSPPEKGVEGELDMVGGVRTERTNVRYGGKRATEEEELE